VDTPPLGVRLASEALGTFIFLFLGFSAIAVATDIGADAITTLGIAFAFGLGLAMAIAGLGHHSGGHFNPAVSAGLAAARKFPWHEVIPYWIAQLVGGFVAALVIVIVYSSRAADALATTPGPSISSGAALLLEIIATAGFVIVICTVATDDRAPWKGVMAPLLIGLYIFTAAAAVGPASGGSFNPARSITPAFVNGEFGDLWIYILGPLAGGVIGAVVWVALAEQSAMRRTR
jgi:MIP family channel proteins